MSTIQSAETGNHIPPQQLTQALSFTPRGYHLAQKERALLQLSILPSHAHINSIAQYNFKYGYLDLINSPLCKILKNTNHNYAANYPLPQPKDRIWIGDSTADIALSYNSLPNEIKPYAWVENFSMYGPKHLAIYHCRLGIFGLSPEPLYLDHSQFHTGLNLQFAQPGTSYHPYSYQNLAIAPPAILEFNQPKIVSEFSNADKHYLISLQITDKANFPPIINCLALEQDVNGIIVKCYESAASIPLEPNSISLEEIRGLNLFETCKIFQLDGSRLENQTLTCPLIRDHFERTATAAYNGLVRGLAENNNSEGNWEKLAGVWAGFLKQ